MENIVLEKSDRIGTLTLNRPEKLNAFSDELVGVLGEVHPLVSERYGLGAAALAAAELELDPTKAAAPARYPV